MRADKVEFFVDQRLEHRWRYKAANGETLAVSSEGYKRRRDARTAARRVTGHGVLRRLKFYGG